MKILITGGNGYVGNILYNNLHQYYDITKISRDNFDLKSPKEVYKFFEKNYFDVVFHCAVKGGNRLIKDNIEVLDNNLIMYYNLLSNKNYNKFIHFGSGAEIYNPNEPYGLSKKIIRSSILEKDNFYNIRIYALFNENEYERRFIKSNILRYINKNPIVIHKNKKMDFFHVDDFMKIITYYINSNNPPKEIDCVYEQKYNLVEIAEIINSLGVYKSPIQIENNGMDQEYIGNYLDLGLKYDGLQDGIKKMYKIFIENTIIN